MWLPRERLAAIFGKGDDGGDHDDGEGPVIVRASACRIRSTTTVEVTQGSERGDRTSSGSWRCWRSASRSTEPDRRRLLRQPGVGAVLLAAAAPTRTSSTRSAAGRLSPPCGYCPAVHGAAGMARVRVHRGGACARGAGWRVAPGSAPRSTSRLDGCRAFVTLPGGRSSRSGCSPARRGRSSTLGVSGRARSYSPRGLRVCRRARACR